MKVSYGPLWKTLIDKQMTKLELRESAGLSKGTITKMGKDEPVGLEIITRIATVLGTVNIADIVELVAEKEGETTRVSQLETDL